MNTFKAIKANGPYLICAVLRVIVTCLPQIGYIHPDEYFQSIEVIAEKSFGVEVNKPWEFNATFPIRSVTAPYVIVGSSFQLLKWLNSFFLMQFNIGLITPYFILVTPRLIFCCLSFVVDWSLYKICATNNEKFKSRCLILASSYVMTIYATRTFSNTIELILFSLLLYFVSESMVVSSTNVKQREYINLRYNTSKTAVDRAKFHKLRLCLKSDSLRNCVAIATITVVGFFNRPTFVAFAVAPVFFWLYRGLGFRTINSLNFHLRMFAFIFSAIPTILVLIVIDSFHFGYLTFGEIGVLKLSLNNFVVTPLNFIKYNINPGNLAQHGLHPHYLHVGVNVPLLFNVLALAAYYNLCVLFLYLIQAKYNYLPTVRSIRGLMMASYVTPLLMLSIFPHQEPRFLLPLILPLVYLYGAKIVPEKEGVVAVKSSTNKNPSPKKTSQMYLLFKAWLIINIALAVFYGFVHQAGIFPFVSRFHNELKRSRNHTVIHHVITSHIYSVPRSLLLQKLADTKQLHFYEEGGQDLEKVLYKIELILEFCQDCKVHLLIPSSLIDDLKYRLYKYDSDIALNNTVTFYPHVSTEALPSFAFDWKGCKRFLSHPSENVVRFFKRFGLAHMEFTLNATAGF